ncbi:MAG: MopE-related protein [bacterium]
MRRRGLVGAGLLLLLGCTDGDALDRALSGRVAGGRRLPTQRRPARTPRIMDDAQVCRPERCDGTDDDCDGQIDEEACAACEPGDFVPCYDGDAETINVGVCRAGIQRCGPEGRLLPCEGHILPAGEVCNSADDDCDGRTDEDFADQVGQPCSMGVGACMGAGTFLCDADGQRCAGEAGAAGEEVCNGVDDDCDGRFDEGFGLGEPCAVGVGACRREGVTGCGDDGGVCQARVGSPAAEQCNGVDDDCDGATDEGEVSCYTGPAETLGVGRCRSGRGACGGACDGELLPVPEDCNGQDDDCDGVIDNRDRGCSCDPGTEVACFDGEGQPGVGRCRAGRRICAPDHTFGACLDQIGPVPEECNGQDDDCDGAVDENLAQVCGADTGRCQQGQQICTRGRWGSCDGAIGPSVEACNGIDDDCDGSVDEALTRPCGASVGACRAGTQRCAAGGWGACEGSAGPSGEQCNRADDDCDGATDEGVTNACGGCGAVPAEACDGVDQDCDGRVDEQVVGPVPAEACNGRDDDCDGRADEGLGPDCRPCAVSADCNDANGCTDDRCEAGRCVFTANMAACEDGVFCNGTDRCQGGLCQLHTPRDCGREFCSPVLDRWCSASGRRTARSRHRAPSARAPTPPSAPRRAPRSGWWTSRAARAGCAR